MNKSDTIGKLAAALAAVQAEMQPAVKDAKNPFFKSTYADLGSVWHTCRDLITKNGLAVSQLNRVAEPYYHSDHDGNQKMLQGVIVETVLMHSSGEWIGGEMYLPLTKNDPQSVGSAITYGRRYGLAAILGIVTEDDDGNAGSGHVGNNPVPQNRQQPQRSGQQSRPQPNTAPEPQGQQPAPVVDLAEQSKQKLLREVFGEKTPAAKRQDEFTSLCQQLNAVREYFGTDEQGNPILWGPRRIDDRSQADFDKPLHQLDAEEVQILITDLTSTLEERRAMNEMAAAPAPEATAPEVAMAEKKQIAALRKMANIKGYEEEELMAKATGGAYKSFDQLSAEQAGEMLKALSKAAAK